MDAKGFCVSRIFIPVTVVAFGQATTRRRSGLPARVAEHGLDLPRSTKTFLGSEARDALKTRVPGLVKQADQPTGENNEF
jgi:hypothetical protein